MGNKKRIIYIGALVVELLILVMLAVGALQVAGPVEVLKKGTSGFRLQPGIYEIRIEEKGQYTGALEISFQEEVPLYKNIRNESFVTHVNSQVMGHTLWVGTETAGNLVYDYESSPDQPALARLYRTNKGVRVAFATFLAFFLILDGMVLLRERILQGKVNRNLKKAVLGIGGASLLVYFPSMTDYLILGEMTYGYLERISLLSQAIQHQTLSPSMIREGWYLLLPALMLHLGFTMITAYHVMVFLFILAGGIGIYGLLASCMGRGYGALAGSLVYQLQPWYIDGIYRQGNVAWMVWMMAVPWCLWGIVLVVKRIGRMRAIMGTWQSLAKEADEKWRLWIVVFMGLVIFLALYRVNRIAYTSGASYIYEIKSEAVSW